MNTSVEKGNKKRKSLGGQNKTPAKVAKLDESVKSPVKVEPSLAKSPKKEIKPVVKSPKKEIKSENKAKPQNGVSPKLKKFKGTKTIKQEDAVTKDAVKPEQKKDDKKRGDKKTKTRSIQGTKNVLVKRMQAQVAKQGKEEVIKFINGKIDAIVSRPKLTKTAKKSLRIHKYVLNIISGGEAPVTATAVKKENASKKVPVKKEQKNANEAKKNKAPVVKVEPKVEKESDEEEDSETSFQNITNAEAEEDSDDDAEEEEESDGEGEEDSDAEEDGSDDEEVDDDEDVKPAKKVEPKKKGLDMNGSQLKNRKINVQYTQGGNKNGEDRTKQIKAKNFKLQAMRKQGKQGQKGSPKKGGSPFKGKNKK